MDKVVSTVVIVVVTIGASAGLFIGLNKLFDLPRDRWRTFTTVVGGMGGFGLFAVLWANRVIDTGALVFTLIATVVGAAAGYALGTIEDRMQRLAIGAGTGGLLGLMAGIAMRADSLTVVDDRGRPLGTYEPVLPGLDVGAMLLWTAIGIAVGFGYWALRKRHDSFLGPVAFWAGIGWLLGTFPGSDLGTGSRGEAIIAAVVGGLMVGAWLGLVPLATAVKRDAVVHKSRTYIFLAPALIFIGVTLVLPTLRTIYLSFLDKRGEQFVGVDNYGDIFTDDTIIDVSNWAGIFTSRLFWIGAILLVGGLVTARILGRRTGHRLEVSPGTMFPVAFGVFFLSFAIFTVLRATIINNLWWVFTVTLLATSLGLAIAVLADRARFESVAKSLIFMPMAISFVGAGIIWRFMYIARDPSREQTGVLNALWVGLGRFSHNGGFGRNLLVAIVLLAVAGLLYLAYRGWRAETLGVAVGSIFTAVPLLWFAYALLVGVGGVTVAENGDLIADTILFQQESPFNNIWLMVVLIWIQTGFTMVIFSAAIKAVPSDLIEASKVDGATESQTFWRVVVPQIAPTIGVVVTTLIVLVMKVFDIVKVMTNGNFDTQVIANEMWQRAFTELNFGLGSALAVVLFIAVLPVMYLNIRRMQEAA